MALSSKTNTVNHENQGSLDCSKAQLIDSKNQQAVSARGPIVYVEDHCPEENKSE